MKFLLPLLFSIPLFAGTFSTQPEDPSPKALTETSEYKVYCAEGYKILKFKYRETSPIQLMMDHNELVVPYNGKPYTLHSIAPMPCNLD